MRIDRVAVAVVVLGLASAGAAAAQDPLTSVGSGTQVRSIEFRFEGEQTIPTTDLQTRIALTDRGSFVWFRKIFGWIPLIAPVEKHPFDPVVLQRDVVRLRQHYQKKGFLQAEVSYDVTYDAEPDLVDITFVIREGPPLLLASLEYVGNDDSPPLLAPELEDGWASFVRNQRETGGRLTEDDRVALAEAATRWLRNRGYPFGTAETIVRVDSAANRAAVRVLVTPRERSRIREFTVSGNRTVPPNHLTRQLPAEPGEWYDASQLEQGRQHLMQLDIVRLALFQVPRESIREDSSVAVRLRVTENPPRLVRGEMGIASGGGLIGTVDWTHRSFLGGVRTLSVAATAQTGLLALESPPQQEYRLSPKVFQPYVGDRRLSLAAGPFGEYRSDLRDRSWAVGFESAMVFASGPLRSIALGYTGSHRRILDYGFGDDLDPIEYLPLLGLAEPGVVGTLGNSINRSVVTLDGSYGYLDQFANPRQGYVLRPRFEVTTPGFNTSEYVLLELTGTGFLPLSDRIGFTVRGGLGRIYPFGKSVRDAGEESPFVSLLRLRDATFTAGGTRDVRGWGSQLLGPKLPQVELRDDVPTAERYAPVGGLARALTSAEMHLPIPGLGPEWQSFLFLDGGRIWTPDDRFGLDAGELDQDRFFWGTGFGFGYETVVGAVQVALGYKLNPSPLDLRDPDEVLDALVEGRPLSTVPTDSRRRLHLHFSIGATF